MKSWKRSWLRPSQASPTHEALLEQSVLGWKEYELEVIRDAADNAIVVCSVENFDAMGVHTGDSITVAPQQTLSDREYQDMRDEAFAVIRRVGVATGGSNIQFAVDPENGDRVVIEMNPRVSRSSALASKATGFPIAKIAALLAIGYTLDELPNDITGGKTVAAFEPSLDYTVVKIPRWAFEKFPATSTTLGTSMKSVGEVMAIGGTFREALMKGLAALELDGSEERRQDPHGRPRAAAPAALRAQLGAPLRGLRGLSPGPHGRGHPPHLAHRSLVPARDRVDRRARALARRARPVVGPGLAAARGQGGRFLRPCG